MDDKVSKKIWENEWSMKKDLGYIWLINVEELFIILILILIVVVVILIIINAIVIIIQVIAIIYIID